MKSLKLTNATADGASTILQWLKDQKVPVLVEIWDRDCEACKILEPELLEIAREFEGKIVTRRIAKEECLPLLSQWVIKQTPALILFLKGKIVWKHEGLLRLDQIQSAISENLIEE